MNKNTLLLYSPIYNETVESLTKQLMAIDENEDVELWINSPGGSVFAGYALITALQKRKGKVDVIVTGNASSMAFYLLMFVDSVKAIDTSNFTVHRADSWVFTEDDQKLLDNINKGIRSKLEKRVDKEEFEKTTKVPFDEVFSNENRKDVHLTAKQAKKIGIVSNIIKLEPRQIAAMANLNINSNHNKMSLTNYFKNNKPQKPVAVGENQLLYREIGVGKKVELLGIEETFTGSFEAEGKKVDVIENEITAISEVNIYEKQINELKAEITAIKAENNDNEKTFIDIIADMKAQIEAQNEILKAAKLAKSNPKLPEGEFKGDKEEQNFELSIEEKIALAQKEIYEAKQKAREA